MRIRKDGFGSAVMTGLAPALKPWPFQGHLSFFTGPQRLAPKGWPVLPEPGDRSESEQKF